jgi:hypothetical protein
MLSSQAHRRRPLPSIVRELNDHTFLSSILKRIVVWFGKYGSPLRRRMFSSVSHKNRSRRIPRIGVSRMARRG